MALRLIPRSLRRSGFFVTVTGAMREHCRQLHASVEASRPRGFVVREPAHSSFAQSHGHRIPHPTSVTIAKRPSWWARDARRNASDLPDVASELPATRWHDGQISCGARNGVKGDLCSKTVAAKADGFS
jgi:hypothetical protein